MMSNAFLIEGKKPEFLKSEIVCLLESDLTLILLMFCKYSVLILVLSLQQIRDF